MIIGRRRFAPRAGSVLLTLAGVGLFVALGLWQLERAAWKQDIEDRFEARLAEDYRLYDPAEGLADAEYRKLIFRGQFETAHDFLLDNQVHRGRAGFHVLTPFRLAGTGEVLLVDRGWVALGRTRQDLPVIPPPPGAGQVAGIVSLPSKPPLLRGDFAGEGWPRVIPYVDFDILRARYDENLLPVLLWLGPEQPGHFERDWDPLWLPPEKSRAYAVQWFGFAALAAILFVILNLHKVE